MFDSVLNTFLINSIFSFTEWEQANVQGLLVQKWNYADQIKPKFPLYFVLCSHRELATINYEIS